MKIKIFLLLIVIAGIGYLGYVSERYIQKDYVDKSAMVAVEQLSENNSYMELHILTEIRDTNVVVINFTTFIVIMLCLLLIFREVYNKVKEKKE